MATLALKPIKISSTSQSGAASYGKIAVSASATFANGDLLLKTNNAVTVCGADPAIISYFAPFTSSDAVPGETKFVLPVIKPEDTFEITAYHSTAANATVADADLDGQSDYGVILATVSGVSAWCLDLEDTSNKRVRLLGRLSDATDLYPRVLVKFLPSILTNFA
jgi:hypothetical protein